MKASPIWIVSAAILVVVSGVGIGITRALRTQKESPVLNLEDLWRSPKSNDKIARR
jgi:hypothetical protein